MATFLAESLPTSLFKKGLSENVGMIEQRNDCN
jgi:hypothetical protein